MAEKILIVGMINCDIPLFPVPSRLQEFEVVRVQPPKFSLGGDAANVAVSLARLGAEPSIIGRIGADAHGDFALAELRRFGVDTSLVQVCAQDVTSTSFHLLQEGGAHNFIFYSTTLESLCAEDIPEEALKDASIVYFGSALTFPKMDEGGIARLFRRAHAYGAVTVMDAALSDAKISGEAAFRQLQGAFRETDIFFPSLVEMEYLTGQTHPHAIARCFQETGIGLLGIKLGGRGCYVTDFEREYRFPAHSGFRAVDTVGAGDSFLGGLIYSLQKSRNLEENISFAGAVAGFNIEHIGATAGVPQASVVESFIHRNRLRPEIRDFHSDQ